MYDLQGKIILLHGPNKGGKTTLASSFPKCIILGTEPGHDYVDGSTKIIPVRNWEAFLKQKDKAISKNPKTIVIDKVNSLYRQCKLHVCMKTKNVKHPSEAGEFGRTIWDKIGDEYAREIEDYAWECREKGITFIMICDTEEEEIETDVETVKKVMASLPKQARRVVPGIPDHIWFLGYANIEDLKKKEEAEDAVDSIYNFRSTRALWLRGGDLVEAGCRDRSMKRVVICPLIEPNFEDKKGGYWQIIEEMETVPTRKKKKKKK